MDLDLTPAVDRVSAMGEALVRQFPNVVLGMLVVLFFWLASGWVERGISRLMRAANRSPSAVLVFGRLTRYMTILLGLLLALLIIVPDLNPADFLGALGVGSVAIGFAFRDVLQNFLAGLLLLLTEPFRLGDQIAYKDFEGTVEDIQIRATALRTYDGRRVLIPNAELFTNAIIVNTAFPQRRSQYDVGIGYGDDIEHARALMLETMQGIEGVSESPAPDVVVVGLDESVVALRARWWTDATRGDVIRTQDRVLTALKARLAGAGVDLPFPTQVVLFHDQSEESDGDRRRQREGWPAGPGEVPAPRKIADALLQRPPE